MKIQHLIIILNQTLAFKLFCIIGKYVFFNECFFFGNVKFTIQSTFFLIISPLFICRVLFLALV